MALIGGTKAREFLREGSLAFGDPESPFYNQSTSQKSLFYLLGLYKTVLKGYLRVIGKADEEREHLRELKELIPDFLASIEDRKLQKVLRRILGSIKVRLA
jgi:hypothetical protein